MVGTTSTTTTTQLVFDPAYLLLIQEIRDVLRLAYHHGLPVRSPAKQFFFWHRIGNNVSFKQITKEPYMLQLTDIQQDSLAIAPVDAMGNAAPVQGVVWSVADPTLLTLTPSVDGLSCEIAAIGPEGTTQVNVQADANVGSTPPQLLSGSIRRSPQRLPPTSFLRLQPRRRGSK